MKFKEHIKTKRQLREEILKAVNQHHIWINAFTLVRPTDETFRKIGEAVVAHLKDRESLLPSYTPGKCTDEIHDLSRLTPTLYISINAS